jgi:cysteinyl-tRNA synthetase, unknown class
MSSEVKWDSVETWVYQLCNYKDDCLKEVSESAFDLAVIDLSRDGGEGYFSHEEISAVKKSAKIVLAYFEIAAIEEYRPEWKIVPNELKAGPVNSWPKEQYVKFWDERWWPIVKGRIDQALKAGFDGAYLDMITSYEEIPDQTFSLEERAHKMVELICRISAYAKAKKPNF